MSSSIYLKLTNLNCWHSGVPIKCNAAVLSIFLVIDSYLSQPNKNVNSGDGDDVFVSCMTRGTTVLRYSECVPRFRMENNCLSFLRSSPTTQKGAGCGLMRKSEVSSLELHFLNSLLSPPLEILSLPLTIHVSLVVYFNSPALMYDYNLTDFTDITSGKPIHDQPPRLPCWEEHWSTSLVPDQATTNLNMFRVFFRTP